MHIRQIEAIYPVSPGQHALLLDCLSLADDEGEGGHLSVTVEGDLDPRALSQAWQQIVCRHPILRTSFAWKLVSRPLQLVHKLMNAPLAEHDWRMLPHNEKQKRLVRLVEEDKAGNFDPSRLPLISLKLYRIEENAYRLIANYHPLILDSLSAHLLLKEVFALYEEIQSGRALDIEPAGPSFGDYLAWLKRQRMIEAEKFWRGSLKDFSVPTSLPVERQKPCSSSCSFQAKLEQLSASLTTTLRSLAERQGLNLGVLVQGAWALLLSRYSGEQDVLFGAAISGRPLQIAGSDSMIGPLTGVLPLRVQVPPDTCMARWLKKLQTQLFEINQYGHCSLAQIKGWSEMAEGFPLFETMTVFNDYSFDELGVGPTALKIKCLPPRSRRKQALTLVATMKSDGLEVHLTYDEEHFEAVIIERMLGHLRTLLEAMAAASEQPLSTVSILTREEQQQFLVEWNQTSAAYPSEHVLPQLFEERALQMAEAIAVEHADQRLSYKELNRRANQLAHYLQRLGVGPEVLVGICVERSMEMIVGLLGILKAGGAYLPLDPRSPLERLSFMLEDTQVPVLLTQERLLKALPAHWGQVLCLDTEWEQVAQESGQNPEHRAEAENLAYVIYTSGSTGKPKGVLIHHRGLINYLHWCIEAYKVDQGGGAPVYSPYTFDLTITSLFAPLLSGTRTVLLPNTAGVEALTAAFRNGRDYSFIKLTPAHLEVLEQQLSGVETSGCTRTLIIGGDALTVESLAFWQRHAPETEFFNEYGPTETVVGCCVYRASLKERTEGRTIPIGWPIANTQLYLLNAVLQPVPVGVPGELYIGGAGLARGYLNRQELTAEKFIPNPFSVTPGERLYRTGDLARHLPDGNLEFLGRLDHQVKIRGYRIELGEIEVALDAHPRVRQAIVIAREDSTAGKRLVAYISAQDVERPTASELRSHLGEKLPEYMIPAAFIIMDRLPLTPNGKVDRRTLEAVQEVIEPKSQGASIGAGNHVEELLIGIWKQVLGVEQVGLRSNFFELGGDSILGIKVIAKANQAGLRLTPDQLFQYPTIDALATAAGETPAVEAEQQSVGGPLPLTPIQHWFFEQNFKDPHHWNIAVMLEAPQSFDYSSLEKVVRELLRHHDALRLRFARNESGWRQINADEDALVPCERVDLSSIEEAEQERVIELTGAKLQASLNLREGPLMRAAHFDLGENKPGRLFLILHHLISDGVSLRVLLEDLQTGHQQLSQGEEIKLPPKTTSFKKWAERQAEYAQSEEIRQELAYWLAGSRGEIGKIPIDYTAESNVEATARVVTVSLSSEETRALLQEVPRAYRTQINDAMLTALAQAFSMWRGVSPMLVDLEGHGRESLFADVDLSRTVGWFTTIFPVLLDVGQASTPQYALKSIKEHLRLIPRRGIGYGLLRYLNKDAGINSKLRALPQAEVSFNYLGQFDQPLGASSPFRLSSQSVRSNRSPFTSRPYLLEIVGRVLGGTMHIELIYSESVHRRATIEELGRSYLEALRLLIAHCQSPEAGGYTPSDFPKAKLSQQELDKFLARIGKAG